MREIEVEMQGIRTKAVVDTGAPYVICPPRVAREAGFEGIEPLARLTMLIRGMRLEGSLIRLCIRITRSVSIHCYLGRC